MGIIFQYLDKKKRRSKVCYIFLKKGEKNNIYKLQQLDFSAQIC